MKRQINIEPLDGDEIIYEIDQDFPIFAYHEGIHYSIESTRKGDQIRWLHQFSIDQHDDKTINKTLDNIEYAMSQTTITDYQTETSISDQRVLIELRHLSPFREKSFASDIHNSIRGHAAPLEPPAI